jgi:PAS domain S-box-containing protein
MPVIEAVDISAFGPDIFRLAIDACPNGIVIVGGDGNILMSNAEVERVFGYRREELHGRPVEILMPEESRGKHAQQRRQFMTQPNPRHLGTGRDFLGRRKDGSEFPIEVGLNPVRSGDSVLILGSIVDISERKRLEQLQDEFVSTVSHELRTPMTSIAAALGLLCGGSSGPMSDPAQRLLAIAQANCQRLVRLINDLLDIKKLESGKAKFDFQRCDARQLLEKAIEENRALAEDSAVGIRLEALPGPLFVDVDPDRFIQVVTNLLSNAIKFSPREAEVVVASDRRGDTIRIAVRDHGSGIPVEFKPLIFENFMQAERATPGGNVGTGLGLSIARKTAELMHGRVGFDDAPEGGTIFYFELPAAEPVARPAGEGSGERATG